MSWVSTSKRATVTCPKECLLRLSYKKHLSDLKISKNSSICLINQISDFFISFEMLFLYHGWIYSKWAPYDEQWLILAELEDRMTVYEWLVIDINYNQFSKNVIDFIVISNRIRLIGLIVRPLHFFHKTVIWRIHLDF